MNDEGGRGETETSDGRDRDGRLASWFLVEGNRIAVAGLLLAATYVLIVAFGTLGPGSAAKLVPPDPISALFPPLVVGVLIGVTTILTLNQLVLSQELGPLGQQRAHMTESMTFREDVEDVLDAPVSPTEPSAFLRALVEATGARARAVLDGDSLPADVVDYAEQVVADAERVGDDLEDQRFGSFDVIDAALEFEYPRKIHAGRRVREAHEESLSEETLLAFDELIDALGFFGPAREHFKTLYFRWEIIGTSRTLVYASPPALAVVAYMVLIFEPSGVTGQTAGLDHRLLFVGAAFVLGVAPFAIFTSHVLRIVTVTQRTLAIGPFVLDGSGDDTEREG